MLLRSEHDEVSLLDAHKRQRPPTSRASGSTPAVRGTTSFARHGLAECNDNNDDNDAKDHSSRVIVCTSPLRGGGETGSAPATAPPANIMPMNSTTAKQRAAAMAASAQSLARDIHTLSSSATRSFVQYAEEAYTPARGVSAQQLLNSQRVSSLARRDPLASPSSSATAAGTPLAVSPPRVGAEESMTGEGEGVAGAKRSRSMNDIMDSLRFHF